MKRTREVDGEQTKTVQSDSTSSSWLSGIRSWVFSESVAEQSRLNETATKVLNDFFANNQMRDIIVKNIYELPAPIRSLFVNEDGALSLVLMSALLTNLRNVVLTDLSVSDMRQRVPEYIQCIHEVKTVERWQFQSVVEPKGAFDSSIGSAVDQFKEQMLKIDKSLVYEFSGDGRHRIVSGPIEEFVRLEAEKEAEKLERERLKSESAEVEKQRIALTEKRQKLDEDIAKLDEEKEAANSESERLKSESAEIEKQRAAVKSQLERQQRAHQEKERAIMKKRDEVQSELDAKAKQLENDKIQMREKMLSIQKETDIERSKIQEQHQKFNEELSRLNAKKDALKSREERLEVASVQMVKSKIQCMLQNGVVVWEKEEEEMMNAYKTHLSGWYDSWNTLLL